MLLQQYCPGRNENRRRRHMSKRTSVYLWEFVLELLADSETTEWIGWVEKEQRKFQIKNVPEVATLWGAMKAKPELGKEALLRSLRYYYKTKILRKVPEALNTYQFLELPIVHPSLASEDDKHESQMKQKAVMV